MDKTAEGGGLWATLSDRFSQNIIHIAKMERLVLILLRIISVIKCTLCCGRFFLLYFLVSVFEF